jgi:hypothetical protein
MMTTGASVADVPTFGLTSKALEWAAGDDRAVDQNAGFYKGAPTTSPRSARCSRCRHPNLAPGERWTPDQGIPVLGRLDDAEVAKDWPGHAVLDLDGITGPHSRAPASAGPCTVR